MFITRRLVSFMALCLVVALSIPALAQTAGQQGQQQISDADLEKAAMAYMSINRISQEFQQALQDTQDPNMRQQLQQTANEQMVEAVKNTGLEVQEYNDIMGAVRSDEQLNQEFMSKVQ
jgi:predicted PurR-regulated permease PerM